MDSFWSKLLILGIVAAIGLFFIYNVYTPQKTAQEAMADSTQQSVNAVKLGVENSAPLIVNSENVIHTVNTYCKTGNTIRIVITKVGGTSHTFTTSTVSDTSSQAVGSIVDSTRYYVKKNSTGEIRFTEQ
jgi:hypothetical protein